jgi:hypothetical protein
VCRREEKEELLWLMMREEGEKKEGERLKAGIKVQA